MHSQQINLLEAMALAEKDGFPIREGFLAWGLAILILVTGFGIYRSGTEIAALHKEIAGLQQKKVFMKEALGTAEAAMKDVVQILAQTLSERTHWSKLMREVSLVIPEGVWITHWESLPQTAAPASTLKNGSSTRKSGPKIKMIGEALTQEKLTRFLSTLDRSPLLLSSRLVHARQINGEVQFEVLVILKAEKAP